MARPAVNFNRVQKNPVHLQYYDQFGNPVGPPEVYSGESEYRMLIKPASITTKPTKNGVYVEPTGYFSQWCRMSSRAGVTYYRPSPSSGYALVPDDLAVGIARSPTTLYYPSPSVWNELEIKALNKLKSQTIHLGNFLGTADQTAKMFQSGVSRAAAGVRSIPSATLARAKKYAGRIPSKVPSAYLEVMYGVTPFLEDLLGACSALDSIAGEGQLFQVKARKYVSSSVETASTCRFGVLHSKALFQADHRVILRYRLRSRLLAKLSSLGLVNPLELLWERLPYSFLVDWVTPVGNWLSALSGDFGYDFVLGCRSTFCAFTENGPYRTTVSPPTAQFSAGPNVRGKYGYFQRTPYTSSPVPGIYIKSPVSATHIAEALSLLATSFRR